jgi:Transposase zinc-binding domain/Putative transposase
VTAANSRNGVEVADVLRQYIGAYRARYKMPVSHLKVASAILNCRTAYLGGHIERCDHCQAETIAYNSCRNRHCPKCQCLTKERWLSARRSELLPTRYFHAVFTVDHALNPVILTNKHKMLNILFKAASETLLVFGRNPDNGLGGQLGIIALLHTWDQKLRDHFHLHCLVPAGALCNDRTRRNADRSFQNTQRQGAQRLCHIASALAVRLQVMGIDSSAERATGDFGIKESRYLMDTCAFGQPLKEKRHRKRGVWIK